MDIQKVFTAGRNEAVIQCSNCGRSKTIDVSSIRHIRKPIRVKCSCTHAFNIMLDERRHYRKPTKLPGIFSKAGSVGDGQPLTVENVSKSGLGFVAEQRVLAMLDVKLDDKLNIEFRLDNSKGSLIKCAAVVRYIGSNYVGVEFCGLNEHVLKELGFYLMP